MSGNRRNNKMDMTISEQLERIKSEICWKYCRFNSEDESQNENLEIEHCNKCPLKEI